LRMLESDGFVVSTANRGVRVAQASLGDAEDFYAARLCLEPPLLASIAGEIDEAGIRGLRSYMEELRAASDRARDFHSMHRHFHELTFATLGEAVHSHVSALSRRVFWLQRAYMSRRPVAHDFIATDELLLSALERKVPAQIRALQEFHMLDAAIGLIVDVEPEHRFRRLLGVCDALGIEVGADQDGRIALPAPVRWSLTPVPPLRTAHLETF
jgi:DNA-binding GntR family transcriptional regulator